MEGKDLGKKYILMRIRDNIVLPRKMSVNKVDFRKSFRRSSMRHWGKSMKKEDIHA